MRKYTTGFEEGDSPASNYYDSGRATRHFVTGRNGQGLSGTYGQSTRAPYAGLQGPTILPPVYGGSEGSDYPHSAPGPWSFIVQQDVGVILRLYMRIPAYPAGFTGLGWQALLSSGVIGNTAPSVSLGDAQAAVKIYPDGMVGLWMLSATRDEADTAVAANRLPGTSVGLPWGGAVIPLDTWTCVEVAFRMGAVKGYAAMRIDGQLMSEAACITFPWSNYGNADAYYGFLVREVAEGDPSISVADIDDVAVNDETGDTDNTWPGPDTGIFYGGSHPDCLADPAGSGYYDCGLVTQPRLPPSCPLPAEMLLHGYECGSHRRVWVA